MKHSDGMDRGEDAKEKQTVAIWDNGWEMEHRDYRDRLWRAKAAILCVTLACLLGTCRRIDAEKRDHLYIPHAESELDNWPNYRSQNCLFSSSGKNASIYSEHKSRILIKLSAIAYCDSQVIQSWNCTACNRGVFSQVTAQDVAVFTTNTLLISPIQAYVVMFEGFGKHMELRSDENDGTDVVMRSEGGEGGGMQTDIAIAFRGTADISDWLVNLDIYRTKYETLANDCDDCYVHSGFLDAWNDLKEEISSHISNVTSTFFDGNNTNRCNKTIGIHVTGHSLGAAIAILAAADLEQGSMNRSLSVENPDIQFKLESIYTYGSPRVGNKNFAEWFNNHTNAETNRIVHYKDIVPHVPFTDEGYHHTGTEVFYNENSTEFKICDGSGEDSSCSNQFSTTALGISDHLLYLDVSIGSDNGVC